MAKVRRVDDQNDWTFGKGQNDYLLDEAAVEQDIRCRLQSWKTDCFFALQDGVDWQNRTGPAERAALEEEIKSVILSAAGVVSVDTVSAVFVPETRGFTVQVNVQTIFSPAFLARVAQAAGQGG